MKCTEVKSFSIKLKLIRILGVTNLDIDLSNAFDWVDTEEGFLFWDTVYKGDESLAIALEVSRVMGWDEIREDTKEILPF